MGRRRGGSAQAQLFAAQVIPGLEEVAWDEIKQRLAGALRLASVEELVLFRWLEDPSTLLELRTTEDVFAIVDFSQEMGPAYRHLRAYAQKLHRCRAWDAAVGLHRRVRQGKVRRTTCPVVTQMRGRHGFRRVDAQRAVEDVVAARFPRWKWVPDDAHLEVWVHLQPGFAMTSVRLSDRTMRHRRYKVAHLPASLRPTLAAAMVFLSQPRSSDRFCDPMCGAGTILIERAMAERFAGLWGGDRDPRAISIAGANIGPRHQPLALHHWDASRLPLADASLDRLVTNLPFGKQMGSAEENQRLYHGFFQEMGRVLRDGGRAVLLTNQHDLIRQHLAAYPALRKVREVSVKILGQPARIYALAL
ncbi:MAG: RNA methyltransferase [Anaerolineae bacterium]|nr:MAG: RNA methyltransferase [Anaerolineae bacterium]